MNQLLRKCEHGLPSRAAYFARAPITLVLCSVLWASCSQAPAQEECAAIERRLPPEGMQPDAGRQQAWQSSINGIRTTLASPSNNPATADVEVLLKACELAITYNEFYRPSDFDKVDRLLALAAERARFLQDSSDPSDAPWSRMQGYQVRGFRSAVDGSVQPVGLVFPDTPADTATATTQLLPLYVWLHGRGDKTTDLHFINERLDKRGQISPENAVVLHPFGRQCVGYKSAGETDVMEAIDFACAHYPIDKDRIVLMGFSMGGAGVWHLAAHYGERFVAASPGAGFAETARYQRLTPDRYPPKYEQLLWGIYDVPGYARNLFNLPVVAYSGENDKQIQAARVMEEAYREHGRELPHLIGPGMGHKYHPDTLKELLKQMHEFAARGRPADPSQFHIQTRHWRYGSRYGVVIDGVIEPYQDTRVDAVRTTAGRWELTTRNVSRLAIETDSPLRHSESPEWILDQQPVQLTGSVSEGPILLQRGQDHQWSVVEAFATVRKTPGLSGPIDDAFLAPFLCVLPSGQSDLPDVDQWIACESTFIIDRWQGLFRGKMRVKKDIDVTPADMEKYHLVVWGTPSSNRLLGKLFQASLGATSLPMQWNSDSLSMDGRSYPAATHIPQVIFPNPLAPDRYLVINSGPTFRPAHDRTNSLQNPHLPDWVVISTEGTRSDTLSGKVVRTGFFNDAWEFDPQKTW